MIQWKFITDAGFEKTYLAENVTEVQNLIEDDTYCILELTTHGYHGFTKEDDIPSWFVVSVYEDYDGIGVSSGFLIKDWKKD